MERLIFKFKYRNIVIFGIPLVGTEVPAIHPLYRSETGTATVADATDWQLYDDPELVTLYEDGTGTVNKDGFIFEFNGHDLIRHDVEAARAAIAYNFIKSLCDYDTACNNLALSGTSEYGVPVVYIRDRSYSGPLVSLILGNDSVSISELTERLSVLTDLSVGLVVNRVVSDNGMWRGMAYLIFARPDNTYDIYLGDAMSEDSICPYYRQLAVPRDQAIWLLAGKLSKLKPWSFEMDDYVWLCETDKVMFVYDDVQFELDRPDLRVLIPSVAVKAIRREVRKILSTTSLRGVTKKGRYYKGPLIYRIFGQDMILDTAG